MRAVAAGVAALLTVAPAAAQDLERQCIAGSDLGNGLEVAVDAGGVVHLSRVARVEGSLLHTTIEADGTVATEEVAPNISLLITAEVRDTGILVDDDVVHICFHDARRKRLEVASRVAGVWSRVQLEQNVDGGSCDVARFGTKLVVAYEDAGVLRVATRNGANWGIVDADRVNGRMVGAMPSIAVGPDNALVVAHRDNTNGELRVSQLEAGSWSAFVPPSLLLNGGQSPRAVFDGDALRVFHGVRPNRVDFDSDILMLRTEGRLGGAFETNQFFESNIGGYIGAAQGGGALTVFTRRYSRSALFGSEDALYMFRGPDYDATRVEFSGAQGQRHLFRYLSAAHDPFGLPVLAYLDERSAHFNDPSEAPTCFYRPADADGDRLPDSVEAQLGTTPDDPDTDGDGRTDGEEVLLDGTDPLVGDACEAVAETCNGRDDDCDDAVDEGLAPRACYPGPPGTQGVGRCRAGVQQCVDGGWGDCGGAVVPDEEACNGRDDDCDRGVDEGDPGGGGGCATGDVGVCGVGVLRCEDGGFVCQPVAGADDEVCDERDNDCDGAVDEGRRACGVGACHREVDVCVDGRPNACVPGRPAAADALCDNTDDDCDGTLDEDFERRPTECGVGACVNAGERACVMGAVTDTCRPGQPNLNDARCDASDEDCDGSADEDYLERNSACGVGACRDVGRVRCVDGDEVDDCAPGQPRPDDDCDGIDDDCDGLADEDFPERDTRCGQGECAAVGEMRCVDGQEVDTCRAGQPDPRDALCDGRDEDCNGAVDEDFAARDTTCGVGACRAEGRSACRDGRVVDDCVPGEGAQSDPSCDGVDDDCDGAADEAYAAVATQCGTGACGSEGTTACLRGEVVDGCEPLPPAPNDAGCDGVDADCDGRVDEDALASNVNCGVGGCRRTGQSRCVDGETRVDCAPGAPAPRDDTCDGVDDDCDGAPDEDFVGEDTACGSGVCVSQGRVVCVNGAEVDTCVPGDPDAADDDCDGVDDNCNGTADENYQPPRTTCGIGGCAAAGRRICRDGVPVDTCTPNPGDDNDESCNDFDDDCDTRIDEDYRVIDVACGFGACLSVGPRLCVDGELVIDCRPGGGAVDDSTCDRTDDDCDGTLDEDFQGEATSCGVGACAARGVTTCEAGDPGDTCTAGDPAARDDTCDGVDDDCDGVADEDFAGAAVECGVGACAAQGVMVCVDGRPRASCVPAEGGARDATCDGIDDDCDGQADEDHVAGATECGRGFCLARGEARCVNGRLVDTCEPGQRRGSDSVCDGIDADCDGVADERYRRQITRCGVGACEAGGRTACVDGAVVDDCEPGQANGIDDNCDGVDDDCDGRTDEGYVVSPTACGLGVCAAEGVLRCVAGNERDTCFSGPPVRDDTSCDGRDEDCDGEVDEGYDRQLTRCGRGACAAGGITACRGGRIVDDCEPGAPAADDATCDGVDDDCDGQGDEDHQPTPTRCGVGFCEAEGRSVCSGGELRDTCVPGTRRGSDSVCDGIDADCDGRVDERYQPRPVSCGVGACLRQTFTRCIDGAVDDRCTAGDPAPADPTCDDADDDCDGRSDEDFAATATSCGVGACAARGQRRCRGGQVTDSCRPGQPAVDDATCDGVDDDCSGAADEDFAPRRTSCGVGACFAGGRSRCTAGRVEDGCTPGDPAPDDAVCDGIDGDCDGRADEDFVPSRSACGVGGCQSRGEIECRDGRVADTCVPDLPAPADVTCDSVDDDCDQRLDEDFPSRPTACGVGGCAASGQLRCDGGQLRDSCRPGDPAAFDGACDGRDEDCDGVVDEEFAPMLVTCGAGVCAAEAISACVGGVTEADCVPGAPGGVDDDCDGVDQDCDGSADEGYVETPTECGVGACASAGTLRCAGGAPVDDCEEAPPAEDDMSCDGVDDDCDELVDEHCPDNPDGAVERPDAAAADDASVEGDQGPDGAPVDAAASDAAAPPDAGNDGAATPDAGTDLGPGVDASGDQGADGPADGPAPEAGTDEGAPDDMEPGGDVGDASVTGDSGHGERTADGGLPPEITGSGFDCSCDGAGAPAAGWALLLLLGAIRRRRA